MSVRVYEVSGKLVEVAESGDDAAIPAATSTTLGGVIVGSNLSVSGDGTISVPAATTAANGVMSAADKTKLNGIATGANAYTLPAATATVTGGVKRGVAVPNAAADGELATLNALLASLRTAGVIAS